MDKNSASMSADPSFILLSEGLQDDIDGQWWKYISHIRFSLMKKLNNKNESLNLRYCHKIFIVWTN